MLPVVIVIFYRHLIKASHFYQDVCSTIDKKGRNPPFSIDLVIFWKIQSLIDCGTETLFLAENYSSRIFKFR